MFFGRFSAQTADEVDTQVDRTIDYESLPAMNQDWFWRGIGIASAEGAGIGDEGQSDKVHMDEIRGWLLGAGYTEVDQIYDPGATDTQVANAVNAGRGIINYVGHGSSTSWGTTGFNVADVDALVNDNMLPFIVSVACVNGNFDNYGKCFAEAWLRATNNSNGDPTGAVGMYASSINQSWAPPMEGQDEFNILLTDPEKPYSYFGTLCFAGSCSMMDKYGTDGVNMFNTWNIFGDPSVHIVGDPPQSSGMRVTPGDGLSGSGPAGGPVSPQSIDYIVSNLEEAAIDYEVTWDAPWISVTNPSGTLEAGGSVTVTVSFNDTSCNVDNGSHADTVSFVNLSNHDGDTARPANLNIGSVVTIHDWTMASDPGWTVEGEWEYGTPTGDGGIPGLNPDPATGSTGTTVYGANLTGNISKHVGGPYYLTAGPIDTTGYSNVTLTFERWLNTLGPTKVLSWVDVSGDGTSWSTAWSAPALVADGIWQSESFDISAEADNRGSVYIRWGYQVAEKLPKAGPGWNLDDVVMEGWPGSVRIMLSVDRTDMAWNSAPGATGYDIVQGDIDTLAQTGGDFTSATTDCLGNDITPTSLGHTDTPAPGTGYWFLVRAVGSSGPMTYQPLDGTGSQIGLRDAEIDNSGASCP